MIQCLYKNMGEIIMNEIEEYIKKIFEQLPVKTVLSKGDKNSKYKKIIIENKGSYYQVSKYTDKQVFHENLQPEHTEKFCIDKMSCGYRQLNSWSNGFEHMIMISKKGKPSYKRKQLSTACVHSVSQHNRKKNYIINEGTNVLPLIDMGVFTKEGKVVNSMYDKYRQINRFIEIIDDAVKDFDKETINIIDFGCGKSYLTFIVYYYFTCIKQRNVNIIGLDLKEDVIKKCNKAAEKYGYNNLHFQLGDINGYKCDFDVDIVITLHACDTATDYALFNAINWNTKMIFSVPCCQHELNAQIKSENLSIFTNYGIIQERFAALTTDAIRGNLLECCGYKTQLLEFVDFAHTPKNILIRAVKKSSMSVKSKVKALSQVNSVIDEFNLSPTLYKLLEESGRLNFD